MSVFNRDLVVQLLNKLLGKADLVIGKTDEVLGDTKKILTAVSGGTGAVKSVQRGTARFTGTMDGGNSTVNDTLTINISKVNPAKCVAIINGRAFDSSRAGGTGGTSYALAYVANITETTLVLKAGYIGFEIPYGSPEYFLEEIPGHKPNTILRARSVISWQLIEYY